MRKVVWAVGGSFTRKTLPVSLQWFYPGLSERSITTNSAINRGIRRGKIEHFRPDMLEVANSYSKANSYGKRGDQGLERKSFIRLDKARRPNHQQQQDVEDQEALAMIKESRQTPGQKRYPRAGREEPAVQRRQEKPTYSPRQYKEGRWATSSYDRERRETRSRSQNYSPSTSPRPDRMSGREAYPDRLQKSADPKTDRTSRQSRAPDSEDEASGFASQVRQPRASKEALPIPYTTPASEFLYGTSVIIAALKSRRRKMYKLYVYEGDNREALPRDASVLKLALAAGVPVTPVKGDELRLMDKMSTGRPHNGYILEASPLPKLPITIFKPVPTPQSSFETILGHQSREDEAVNGVDGSVPYLGGSYRYPFVLMLDGILDPGNLGAILRTAYFLGVDAVAISTRNSAPLSPVALKASAGASEDVPLLSISQPGLFIDESQKNGWRFYAAVAPPSGTHARKKGFLSTSTLRSPLTSSPAVLMLGGEGEGLRWNLQKKADHEIGIDGTRAGMRGVDSLNVSVAAGLLCEAFLRRNDVGAERMNVQKPSSIDEPMF